MFQDRLGTTRTDMPGKLKVFVFTVEGLPFLMYHRVW